MNKLQHLLIQISAAALIAALGSSCSAEAKKSRLARRAEEFYKAGDYDKAKLEYTNLLRLDPKDPTPFEKIGVMWLEEGAPLRAGPFLVRARELAPARAEVRTKLAEVYVAVGGLEEARKEAQEALKIDPGNPNALVILADSARTPEEIADAEQQVQKSKRPDSAEYQLAVATLALRKNDIPGIEPALQRAIAADPKASTAHLALARYWLAMKNTDSAETEFKKAADLAPLRNSAHLLYSEFKMQMGARDEAISYMNGVVKKAPDFLPAWTLLAKYTAQKNIDEGIALLENVFRRDTQNFDARILESQFLSAKGDPKKTIEALKQLESNYPKIPLVKLELAKAHLQNRDAAQALTTLAQAITLAPDYADAILLQAETNLRMGNVAATASAMEEFLKTNPTSERAQVFLADAYRAQGRFDDSAALLRKQIEAKPQDAQAYLMLGVLFRQQGKIAPARENLEKAFQLSQNKVTAVNQLIEMDIEAKDFATALQRISPALEKYPNEPALLLLEGKIYASQKDWDKAEAALLKVLQLNANVPSAYELLVSVYISAQKLPRAAEQIQAFLTKSPDNPGALMTLALIYSEMKEYGKARDAYEALLASKPDNVMAANNLAYIYSDQLNQLDKARDWAVKARSGDPNGGPVADTLGWILYRLGDYKQAAALLKEAAEKVPNEPEIQYHFAMASYMMGDSRAAQKGFEAAVSAPKDFSGKDEAIKRLALLKEGSAGDASVEQLETLLKQQPDDPTALAKLGELYDRQGLAQKAADCYERAIKTNSTLVGPTLKLAELYAGPLNKKDRALELAKKARDLAPGDARTTSVLGRLAFRAGNYTWAYSLLQESARQFGNDPSVLKDYAWAAYSNSKLAEARQTMERVVNGAPESAEAAEAKRFLAFTDPQMEEGKASALASEVQQKLKEDPAYVPALMLQGRQQAMRSEKESAIKSYDQALKGFPDFAPAQKQLAALYLQDPSQRQKAYELAMSARKSLADDPELSAIIGEASFYKKDYPRAVQFLQESNKKKPLDSTHLYFLGMSLIETKHSDEGREILQRALSSGLPEPLAVEAAKAVNPPAAKSK